MGARYQLIVSGVTQIGHKKLNWDILIHFPSGLMFLVLRLYLLLSIRCQQYVFTVCLYVCLCLCLSRLSGAEGSGFQSGEVHRLGDLRGFNRCGKCQPRGEDYPGRRRQVHHQGARMFFCLPLMPYMS